MSKGDEIGLFFAVSKKKERKNCFIGAPGVQYTYRTCLIVNIEL